MKKQVMKTIAMGIMLAGYASASFAVDVTSNVITDGYIKGRAPVIVGKADASANPADAIRGYSVNVFRKDGTAVPKGENIKVGDEVRITYFLKDMDGDAANEASLASFELFAGVNGDWVAVSKADTAKSTIKDAADGKEVTVVMPVTNKAAGGTVLGMIFQEKTQFGAPNAGEWFRIENIFNTGPLDPNGENASENKPTNPGEQVIEDENGNQTGTNPTKPTPETAVPSEEKPGTGGTGGGENGFEGNVPGTDPENPTEPCVPGDETCNPSVIEPSDDAYTATIVTAAGDATAADLVIGGTLSPKVIDNENGGVDATANFNYKWFVFGTNAAAGDSVTLVSDVEIAATQAITLGVNSEYAATAGLESAKAGIQGFNLKFVATSK